MKVTPAISEQRMDELVRLADQAHSEWLLGKRPNGDLGMPEDLPARHNACTDPCDMLVGPCACGATHRREDVRELFVTPARDLGATL